MAKTITAYDIDLVKILYDERSNRTIGNEKQDDDKKAKLAIDILAENIKQHGLLSPIIVYRFSVPGNTQIEYGIIAGNRRFKAYQMLAQTENKYLKIPAIIRKIQHEEEKKYIQLSENISRKDLTEEEKAVEVYKLYQKLQKEAEGNKTGYGTLAQKIGISRSYVKKLCDLQKEKNEKKYNPLETGNKQITLKIINIESVNKVFRFASTLVDAMTNINECNVETRIQLKSEAKLMHSQMKEVLTFIRETEKILAKDEEVIMKEQAERGLIKQQKKLEAKAEKAKLKAKK